MRSPRSSWITILAVLAVFLSCGVVLGCSVSQRQKTLRAGLVAVDATRDGFIEWDAQHQLRIVEEAASKEEAHAKLESYRTKRLKVSTLFESVYRAIAAAATNEDDTSFQKANELIRSVLAEVKNLRGGP